MALARSAGPTSNRNTGASLSYTFLAAISCTSGNSVFVAIHYKRGTNPTAAITGVTLGGAAMTAVGSLVENTNIPEASIFYKLEGHGLSGDQSLVVTLGASADKAAYCAWEYSGTTAPVVDVNNGGSGSGANSSITLTGAAANAAVLSMIGCVASPTAGAGYTEHDVPNLDWFTDAEYDDDAGVAGDKSVTWTHASNQWVMSAISVVEPAGGGGGGASGRDLLLMGVGT